MKRRYWKSPDSIKKSTTTPERREHVFLKIRIAGISHNSLIAELRKRGMNTDPSEFSKVLRGKRVGPKVDVMLNMIEKIVAEVEHESS